MHLPPTILAPLFFADPAGAVVGKACTRNLGPAYNPPWYGQKTVAGTFAVFAVTCAIGRRKAQTPAQAKRRRDRGQPYRSHCDLRPRSIRASPRSYLTITYDTSPWVRRAIAACASVAEAVGGEYDNLALNLSSCPLVPSQPCVRHCALTFGDGGSQEVS